MLSRLRVPRRDLTNHFSLPSVMCLARQWLISMEQVMTAFILILERTREVLFSDKACKWCTLILSNYFLKFLAITLQFSSRGQLDKMFAGGFYFFLHLFYTIFVLGGCFFASKIESLVDARYTAWVSVLLWLLTANISICTLRHSNFPVPSCKWTGL